MAAKAVLCIEDSPDDYALLEKAFARCGVRNPLLQASSWEEAIDQLARAAAADGIGLIILDLNLPGLNGIEILDLLKQRSVNIPIVIFTTSLDEKVRKACLDKGAVLFFVKPVDFVGLVTLCKDREAFGRYLEFDSGPDDRSGLLFWPRWDGKLRSMWALQWGR